MLTVDFQDILENAAGFCGLDRDNLAASEFADLRNLANNRLRYAWAFRPWDDLERTEERFFRDIWTTGDVTAGDELYHFGAEKYVVALVNSTNEEPFTYADDEWTLNSAYYAELEREYEGDDWEASTAYAIGDVVRRLSDGRFYACHTPHTSGATFDATKFGLLPPFDRYVDFEQTGKTAFNEVLQVTDKDPRNFGDAREVEWRRSNNGIQILEERNSVWIQYWVRVPQLKGSAFDASAIYTAGRQVYYANAATNFRGNFYTCLATTSAGQSPESTAAKWSVIELPRVLQAFVENGIAADWWVTDEPRTANHYGTLAEAFLASEAIRHDEQNRERMRWMTR
jgi:hypothetical protein